MAYYNQPNSVLSPKPSPFSKPGNSTPAQLLPGDTSGKPGTPGFTNPPSTPQPSQYFTPTAYPQLTGTANQLVSQIQAGGNTPNMALNVRAAQDNLVNQALAGGARPEQIGSGFLTPADKARAEVARLQEERDKIGDQRDAAQQALMTERFKPRFGPSNESGAITDPSFLAAEKRVKDTQAMYDKSLQAGRDVESGKTKFASDTMSSTLNPNVISTISNPAKGAEANKPTSEGYRPSGNALVNIQNSLAGKESQPAQNTNPPTMTSQSGTSGLGGTLPGTPGNGPVPGAKPGLQRLFEFLKGDLIRERDRGISDARVNAASRGVYYGTPGVQDENFINEQYGRGLGQLEANILQNETGNELQRLQLASSLIPPDVIGSNGLDPSIFETLGTVFGGGGYRPPYFSAPKPESVEPISTPNTPQPKKTITAKVPTSANNRVIKKGKY